MAEDYRPLPRCVVCGMLIPLDERLFAVTHAFHAGCFLANARRTMLECVFHLPDLLPELLDLLRTELGFDEDFVAALLHEPSSQALILLLRLTGNGETGDSEANPIIINENE